MVLVVVVVAVIWQKRRFVEANFWQPLCLPRISSLEMIYRLRLVSVLAWHSFRDGNYLLTVRFEVANRSFTMTQLFFPMCQEMLSSTFQNLLHK